MRILIATDGSEFSKAALAESCHFIDPKTTKVKVVSVREDILPLLADTLSTAPQYYQEVDDALNSLAKDSVKEAEEYLRNRFPGNILDLTIDILNGFPDRCIVDAATEWKADLIVVGSHGRGFWGRMLGSVSSGVVHHAPCSVLVVRKPAD